ncbi:hypothetical protein [Olleya sp. R77988]|uniref:hypothetical protein n=1 Tax=Olleya sp. R77988 TaxID=3093875 RepID=UPI0037C7710E
MSKELPNNNKSGEVDIMFVFSAFERVFKKIGKFLSALYKLAFSLGERLLIFLLFITNLIRKNLALVALPAIIIFGVVFYLNSNKPTIYSSNLLLKQNFKTGKILYRNISAFNAYAAAQDSVALSRELGIPLNVASNILSINISHNANKNFLIKDYVSFKKSLDSILENDITYEEFIAQQNLEDFEIQSININSKDPNIYEGLSSYILNSLLKNKYFEDLKKDEVEAIIRKKELYTKLVEESDTLQSEYFKLLKDYYGIINNDNTISDKPTINVNLDNKKDRINTKEYDLFLDSKNLKIKINEIEDELKKKEDIFVLQKDFSSAYTIDSENIRSPIKVALYLIGLIVLILIIRELGLVKKLNEFGTKEKLFEKNTNK